MSVVTVPLPPTGKYPVRQATLIKMECQSKVVGVMEIREWMNATENPQARRYVVAAEESVVPGDSAFRLSGPAAKKICVCELSADSNIFDWCSCAGWAEKGTCRHCTALRSLFEKGHLKKAPMGS